MYNSFIMGENCMRIHYPFIPDLGWPCCQLSLSCHVMSLYHNICMQLSASDSDLKTPCVSRDHAPLYLRHDRPHLAIFVIFICRILIVMELRKINDATAVCALFHTWRGHFVPYHILDCVRVTRLYRVRRDWLDSLDQNNDLQARRPPERLQHFL